MKPTTLLVAVLGGVMIAVWWVFFKNTGLSAAISNADVTTDD